MEKNEQYDRVGDGFVAGKTEFFKGEKDFAREYILSHLEASDNKAIVDIGCGAGDDTAVFETLGFQRVYGVDPSEVMIEKARAVMAYPENARIGSYEETGMEDQSVDYVVGRYSLHYLEGVDKGYEEIARILKPGGKLVFTVDHPTADMVEGERFDRDGTTYVKIQLYNKTVEVEFPLHNFSDYFSPRFLELFELIEIVEHTGKDREYQEGPNALAFAARKR